MVDLVGHLSAVDRATLFDALERAATRVGLALFVVHVDAAPPLVIYASELLTQMVGRPRAELVGQPPWALVAPDHRDKVRETIASRGPGAPPFTTATEVLRPDGSRREVEVGVARIAASGAELAVCYFRDRTEEHEALAALQRSEAGFRSLIEHAPDGVCIVQDGRIALANPAAVRMFGVPDLAALRERPLSDFLSDAEAARARARIAQILDGVAVESADFQLLNGLAIEVHSILYEYHSRPAILSFVRDATERRRLQEQLFRGARLAALGTMAATVAHEINNPLTYLQLNLQRLQREAETEPDPARAAILREHVANALHGVERVARIVRDLRVYSRDGEEADAPVDVVAVVDRALKMVEHDLRHRAQLVRRFPEEPAIVDGNAGRLEQVVINLLVNALQALDEGGPSANRITVEIALVQAGVRIAIADTGPGLPDAERVFEPFFTTKPVGKGTGLGLSVCKQLVEHMRGAIEVVETSARGTTIAVVLPRREAPLPAPVVRPAPIRGERLRILVIDDEPQVRAAIKSLLASEHDVELAEDGTSALATLAVARFDVILCDVMMPRMTGRDVYERVRAKWPGLERRMVFITGGAFVRSLSTFLDSVPNLKLRKPFTVEHVLALVRDVERR